MIALIFNYIFAEKTNRLVKWAEHLFKPSLVIEGRVIHVGGSAASAYIIPCSSNNP